MAIAGGVVLTLSVVLADNPPHTVIRWQSGERPDATLFGRSTEHCRMTDERESLIWINAST
jgi:hypothetical protein